jgi:N utilization substance protein B
MLFSNQEVSKIIDQFKNEHRNRKIDFDMFANSLNSIQDNIEKIESILISLNIKDSSIEIIDKSVLYFAINEMINGDLDKPVVIDESLRLSKKFSSPESYKFINASLDKYLKAVQ